MSDSEKKDNAENIENDMTISKRIRHFFSGEKFKSFSFGIGRALMKRPGKRALMNGLLVAAVAMNILGGTQTAMAGTKGKTLFTGNNTVIESEYRTDIKAIKAHPAYTQYSRYLAGMNQKFETAVPNMPILFLDRDVLNMKVWELPENTRLNRSDVIKGWLDYKTFKMELPRGSSDEINKSLHVSEATWWRFVAGMDEKSRKHGINHVCVIMPHDPDTSAAMELSSMTGVLGDAIITIGDKKGQINISKQQLGMFQDMRAMSHCFDKKYAPFKKVHFGVKGQHKRHKMEVFADVHAALMLAQAGDRTLPGKLADVRLLGSGVLGPVFASQKGNDYNPERFTGTVFTTYEALDAVQGLVNNLDPKVFKSLTPMQLIGITQKITEEFSLDLQQFEALQRTNQSNIFSFLRSHKNVPESVQIWLEDHRAKVNAAMDWMIDPTAQKEGHYVATRDRVSKATEQIGIDPYWHTIIQDATFRAGGDKKAMEKTFAQYKDEMRRMIQKENKHFSKKTNTLKELEKWMNNFRFREVKESPRDKGPNLPK